MENHLKPQTSDQKIYHEDIPDMENCLKPQTSDHQIFTDDVPDMENCLKPQTSDHQISTGKILPETEEINLEIPSEKTPSMIAGCCYRPKKRYPPKPDGEDAYFICSWNQTIGVADGVGGWNASGIDPSEYSKGIMGNILMAFVENPVSNPPIDFPYLSKILDEAYRNTRVDGSSTVCLLALSGHELLCLNVGDSGFRVIRKGKTVYASKPQVRRFNHPYQLGLGYSDRPSSALQLRVPVKIGDVVIVGTDGLFDNVFDWQLESLVITGTCSKDTPEGVAQKIAEFARLKSEDQTCHCPFVVESERAGKKYKGGKKDDITVVVAHIV